MFRSIRVCIIGLFFSTAVVAEKSVQKNDFLQLFHKRNVAVSNLLNPSKPQNIKLISAQLKSKQDKRLYEQIASSKKGKKIQFYTMLSKLVINENGKDISFDLLSIKPLVIRKNNGTIVKVDTNNIGDSFFKKNKKNVLLDILIPKSHAEASEDEWAFLYSAAQVGGFTDQWNQPIEQNNSEADFAKHVASFLNHYNVKSINCTASIQATNKEGQPLFGVSFINEGGQRYVYDYKSGHCSSCSMQAVNEKGSVAGLLARHKELHDFIREKLQDSAREVGVDPTLDVTDFELVCSIDEGTFWNSNVCNLIDRNYQKYTADTRLTLMTTNLLTSKISNSYSTQIEEYIQISKQLNVVKDGSGTGKDTTVANILAQCCQDRRCSTEVQQRTQIKMEKDAGPRVSQ